MNRPAQLQALQENPSFDVIILGGGINGACLYHTLCLQGYKVLLVDKKDFASGTSQASGMMLWGGLLYLKNLDLHTVARLSLDRDNLIRTRSDCLSPALMRYLPSTQGGRPGWWVYAGLWLYWLMSLGRRQRPRIEKHFAEAELIRPGIIQGALSYEEAFLHQSDAHFVHHWIMATSGQLALNYAQVEGEYSPIAKRWQLTLTDTLCGQNFPISAAAIINCAGIWTDTVNTSFGITSPYRHVFSKGVYLGLPRAPCHDTSLFFEMGEHGDIITHVPWGPISLWGPTETLVNDIESGLKPTHADVDFLLEHYAQRYRTPVDRTDLISLRCGIRPLVVPRDYQAPSYPLDLSREQKVVRDPHYPWISCYGGKLTGCSQMAIQAAQALRYLVTPNPIKPDKTPRAETEPPSSSSTYFTGLNSLVPSAGWCAQHQHCCTLEDYLRRRTNIAQWVVRGGLGENDIHAPFLRQAALELAQGDAVQAEQLFQDYRTNIIQNFDPLRAQPPSPRPHQLIL